MQYATWSLFLVVALVTLVRAVRQPLRTNVDTAVLFAAPAAIIGLSLGLSAGLVSPGPVLTAATATVLLAMPYLQLRLVEGFTGVPRPVSWVGAGGLVLLAFGFVLLPPPRPGLYTVVALGWFAGLQLYVTVAFWRAAAQSVGVTRRRLYAAAAGALLLAATIVVSAVAPAAPALRDPLLAVSQLAALGSGLAFTLAFATPPALRRLWQEPELRGILSQSARLTRLGEMGAAVRELERAAAVALGAPGASIGLWDDSAQVLRFRLQMDLPPAATAHLGPFLVPGGELALPASEMLAGRVFRTQRPIFVPDLGRADPPYVAVYRAFGATSALVAPISAGDRRLGVLSIYAPRPPIFAGDDLELARLLADQAAVILEARLLLEETLRLRARAEAARLKEDFLSSAAHDLKSPVTALVAQAHLLERRAVRRPQEPPELAGLQRLLQASRRLDAQIAEMLDAARLDRPAPESESPPPHLEPVDLAALAREAGADLARGQARCTVYAAEPVVGSFDRRRLREAIDRLLDNAVKYGPTGDEVRVDVWREGDSAHLTVADQGIGIPPVDLPYLFERFHRGTNVDDRRFAGLGLSLSLVRQTIEEHGGRIWASSGGQGRGSTFHLELPLDRPAPLPAGAAANAEHRHEGRNKDGGVHDEGHGGGGDHESGGTLPAASE